MDVESDKEGTIRVDMDEAQSSVPFKRRFYSSATADQVLEGVDLTGKVAIVTGELRWKKTSHRSAEWERRKGVITVLANSKSSTSLQFKTAVLLSPMRHGFNGRSKSWEVRRELFQVTLTLASYLLILFCRRVMSYRSTAIDYRCDDERKKNYPAWIVNPQPQFLRIHLFW